MATILNIPEQIRHVRRYGEIAAVLVKYGFGDVVQEIGLDRLIERSLNRVGQSARAPDFEHLKREERVRRALEELGPTFVKMGQVLSTRADLIPPEWAEEFRKLQNDVPRVPFEEIRARLEDEFSDDLYDTLEAAWNEALSWWQEQRPSGEPMEIGVEVSTSCGSWRTLRHPGFCL